MGELNPDVIVIGSGPGGEGAAMQLSKSGKRVTLIEKSRRIGGSCTHRGTIPSKALRFAIYQLTEALSNPVLRNAGVKASATVADVRKSAQAIIDQQESMRHQYYVRNNVDILHGHARFKDANTVVLDNEKEVSAEHVVLATGSRPYRPDNVDFDHARIYDSDTILGLEEKPHSMSIYGAGVVGCEYASMLRNFGIKVNLVNSRSELLDFLDDEISNALSYHMRERGVIIRHNEEYEEIEPLDDGVVLHLKSGKQIKTDILLWAAGRTGNSDQLGLESVGLDADSRGYLSVDECFQTSVKNIFAVGDLIGFPSLASAAYSQGRAAANRILGNEDCHMIGEIPSGIYTSPEISCVGKTEKELTEARIPYEVGRAQFKNLARAQITGRTVGMLKILFHPESLEILGVHCFGPNAAEIVHIGQAIMAQTGGGNTLKFFINNTFNYPTTAEAYRVAALNGYNRLF